MTAANVNPLDLGSSPSTAVPSTWLYRTAYAVLPLIRMYYPLLRKSLPHDGLLSVPWGRYRLFFPAAWLQAAGAHVYKSPATINPEFFGLIAPVLRSLGTGAIVDVGAHMGVYLLNFRSCSNAPIVAFEPDPLAFGLLSHNARANRLAAVDLRNVACGDFTGAVGLNTGINSSIGAGDPGPTAPASGALAGTAHEEGHSRRSDTLRSVPLVRLDDQLRSVDSISFLKIDCEGYEYQVLAGARDVLEKHRPVVFVELHPTYIESYGHTLADVCALLRSHGYDVELWDCDRRERSANPLTRFVGRYTNGCVRLADEAAMLAAVRQQPKLVQVFALCRPTAL